MTDPYVKLGWKILKAIPHDDSQAAFEARMAVHSLVWEIWSLQADLAEGPNEVDALLAQRPVSKPIAGFMGPKLRPRNDP